MKNITLFIAAFLSSSPAFGQAPVKRYVLIEHFTNSRCGICASKNPAFYNLIDDYPSDIHHVSIHPSVPYNNCVFYLSNTTENNALTNRYSLSGTPRVALNGTLTPATSQLLPAATLQPYLNQVSSLYVQVQETSGNNRSVTISLRTQAAIPPGTYKLYALIAEKVINLATPNGETVHHDVFREMLTSLSGEDFTPAPLGFDVTYNFSYTLDPGWNPAEVFVTAFVRNETTGEVLNSGTRFDPTILGTNAAAATAVELTPNPTGGVAFANLGDDVAQSIEVFDAAGRRVTVGFEQTGNRQVALQFDGLAPGLYIAHIRGEKGRYVAKIVKE